MYRVLMPIDDEGKRALAQAQAVAALPAAAEGVEVTLLYVFEDEARATESSIRELSSARRAIEYLTEEGGIGSIETEKRWGNVPEVILEVAHKRDVDAIVLGGRKRSSLGSLLLGSVSRDVVLNADRPVMVTGDRLREERKRERHGEPSQEERVRGDERKDRSGRPRPTDYDVAG